MEKNTIIVGTVAVTVTVIILAAMIPVILDASESIISTADNDTEGAITYAVASSPAVTISVADSKVNVNDYVLTPNNQTILASCESYCVFAFNTSAIYVLKDGSYDTVKSGTNAVIDSTGLTYIKNGDSDETEIASVGDVLYASDVNPTYVKYKGTSVSFNFDKDATIYFEANPPLSNAELTPNSLSVIAYGVGTYDDLSYLLFHESGIVASSIEFSSEPTEDKGHMTANPSFNASITNATGTYSSSSADYGVYVPIEYKNISESDSNMRDLINVIPIFLVISVLLLAVGLFLRSRL